MSVVSLNLNNQALKSALQRIGFNSSYVGQMESEKLFTNNEIKESFKNIIDSQDTLKPIRITINRLIDSDKIVPVHTTPGILAQIKYIFSKKKKTFAESNHCLAFFDFETRKIFVLVEYVRSFGLWKNKENLSLVLLHELQHYTSIAFPNSFIKIHLNSLIKYYTRFFKLYFHVDISKKECVSFIKWLHFKFETVKGRNSLDNSFLLSYVKVLKSILQKYYKSKEQLDKDVLAFVLALKLYLTSSSMYINAVTSKQPSVFPLFLALYKSYKAINVIDPGSMVIQELKAPGEVISIESEFNTSSKHFILIKKIR